MVSAPFRWGVLGLAGSPLTLASSRCQLLTVGQVAWLLGQSIATIRKWGALRQIETIRLGRSVRSSTAEVERLIARHRRPVAKPWKEDKS